MEKVRLLDLGKMEYQAAWDYQTSLHRVLVDRKMQNRQQPPGSYVQDHTLILVEHPHVYTLGKSGSMDHLLLNETQLQERGIQYFPINRGGDITYHGPGQIVGYPILDLDLFFNDVHRYVRFLEETIIRTLADFGIEAFQIKDYTGVWVREMRNTACRVQNDVHFWDKQRKICAIGVHLSRWVTLHGFAFNVDTDLRYFDYIVPCGIVDEDKTVTSMAIELGGEVDLETVKKHLIRHFSEVFECQLESINTETIVHS